MRHSTQPQNTQALLLKTTVVEAGLRPDMIARTPQETTGDPKLQDTMSTTDQTQPKRYNKQPIKTYATRFLDCFEFLSDHNMDAEETFPSHE